MATLPIEPELPPLRQNDHGVVFIGKTRVMLQQVVRAYLEGATAEDIVDDYDTLTPADVYGAIAYYLRHREAVEEYLRERRAVFEEARRQNLAIPENAAHRARLLERRTTRQTV